MKERTSIINNLTKAEIAEIIKQYGELKDNNSLDECLLRQKATEMFPTISIALAIEIYAKELSYQVLLKYWRPNVL